MTTSEEIKQQVLAAAQSRKGGSISLQTPSFRLEQYLDIVHELARMGPVVALHGTKLEAEQAKSRAKTKLEATDGKALGNLAFKTYRSFVCDALSDDGIKEPYPIIIAHECPQPTPDIELAMTILTDWLSTGQPSLVISVWRFRNHLAEYLGDQTTTQLLQIDPESKLPHLRSMPEGLVYDCGARLAHEEPGAAELATAIATTVAAGRILVSFMDMKALMELLGLIGIVQDANVRFSQHEVRADTAVDELVTLLRKDVSDSACSIINVDPLIFAEVPDLFLQAGIRERVGLLFMENTCSMPILLADTGLSCLDNDYRLTRDQLAVQSGFAVNDEVKCFATFLPEDLATASDQEQQRTAFNADGLSFGFDLVCLWPSKEVRERPIRHVRLAERMPCFLARLQFMALIDQSDDDGRGAWVLTELGQRLRRLSALMPSRRDFGALCLAARAGGSGLSPYEKNVIARMGVVCSRNATFMQETGQLVHMRDFEYTADPRNPVKFKEVGWADQGCLPLRGCGLLWEKLTTFDKLREASNNFALVNEWLPSIYPVLDVPLQSNAKAFVSLSVADAMAAAPEVDSAVKLLGLPPPGRKALKRRIKNDEIFRIDLEVLWSYPDRLFVIVQDESGFEARSLMSGAVVSIFSKAVLHYLTHFHLARNMTWLGPAGIDLPNRHLMGVGSLVVKAGKPVMSGFTILSCQGGIVTLWQSTPWPWFFLHADVVDLVCKPQQGQRQ